MDYQPVYDIAELCARKNLKHVILCPGSRCAPLTLAFTRHSDLTSRTFSDERSAAFIGLGMAQQTNAPVILVCTSGSAAYNFAPAVAEAFFSQTPLLVFTADRPSEWIAQHDGQTIFQTEIFGKHVKRSFQLPQEYDHPDSQWAINRIVNEAINLSLQEPAGPVHINTPFREPLYPPTHKPTSYSENVRVISEHQPLLSLSPGQREKIVREWSTYNQILIVAGQHTEEKLLVEKIGNLLSKYNIPVAADVISNLHQLEQTIRHSDLFLGQAPNALKKALQPDLLITFGKSLVSKNLKIFLRKYSPRAHWHIQPSGSVADTFKNVTDVFHTTPEAFFDFTSSISQQTGGTQQQTNYFKLWEIEESKVTHRLQQFFPLNELTELEVVQHIMNNLPSACNLHLANSMSVRYANFIGLQATNKNIRVYSNRGTSGIDGCTSTSVGHALASDVPNILITGDLAFFYDRNAFWHNYPLPNLRILLLNNHGGLIFNMIDGPASQPEASEFFITRQQLNAVKLCEEFGFDHLKLNSKQKMEDYVKKFFDFDGKTKILELETDVQLNRTIFDKLKQRIKDSYEL